MRTAPLLMLLASGCAPGAVLDRDELGASAAATLDVLSDPVEVVEPFLAGTAGAITLTPGAPLDADTELVETESGDVPIDLPDALATDPDAEARFLAIVGENAVDPDPVRRRRSSGLRRAFERWRALHKDRRAWRDAEIRLSGIGDSISQGFNANQRCGLIPQCAGSAFGQGVDPAVDSLYTRYGREADTAQAFFSWSGAGWVKHMFWTRSGPQQAEALCSMRTRPNRVVVLLGACDVCQSEDLDDLPAVEEIRAAMRETIQRLASDGCGLPEGARVLVLSVPDVPGLRAAAERRGCQVGYCGIVKNATAEGLDALRARLHSWNDALAAEIAAANAQTGERVRFLTDWRGPDAPSLGNAPFEPEDISELDCLHPWYATGQRKLACWAWQMLETDDPDPDACL
jgi:hypothetical protein